MFAFSVAEQRSSSPFARRRQNGRENRKSCSLAKILHLAILVLDSHSIHRHLLLTRLAAKMALTTQQSNKAMVLADCEAMKEFLEKAQAHANRQVSRPVCLSDQNPLLGRRQYVALNWHVHPAIWLICLTTAWTWKLFMWSLWFLWFCHHLAAQGSLDLKYLAQRFEKGKAWVDDWMSTNHRYFLLPPGPGFSDVQAALVNFAHLGIDGPRNPNPLLDLKKTGVHLPTGTALLHCADRSIIDCDPVPGLCLSSWISVCGRHVAWLTFHLNSMIQVSKTSLLFRNYIEHIVVFTRLMTDWLTWHWMTVDV